MSESLSTAKPERNADPVLPGDEVRHGGALYRIERIVDAEYVTATALHSAETAVLKISEVQVVAPKAPPPSATTPDLDGIKAEVWHIATTRYDAIKPLLAYPTVGRTQIRARAVEVGVDPTTLYRWLGKFQAFGVVSALIPRPRGWKAGKSRLSAEQNQVITEMLEKSYLHKQRISRASVINQVKAECSERGIACPGKTAIYDRIEALPERQVLSARGEKEKARNKFDPAAGRFPGADYPLAVVQADHTPVDLIVVDDKYRLPIARPWLTTIECIYSRMIVGYYLSLDPPSMTSVGLALVHAMLPKEDWLELHGIEAQWPVWGIPKTLHVDNGGDFRGDSLQRACTQHGIHLEYRPVATPRYGGAIERVIGTLMREVHELPGTTFSNVKERGTYNSEKEAALTLGELERYIVTWICKIYNFRKHSKLGKAPIAQWALGIYGDGKDPGIGLCEKPRNPKTLMLDFLPRYERTVQTFGVSVEGLT